MHKIKTLLLFLVLISLSHSNNYENNNYKIPTMINKKLIKDGYKIIKNKCARCHVTPFLTASMYSKKQWKKKFNIKKEEISEEQLLNNNFYKAHSLNNTTFDDLIYVTTKKPCKMFLYRYSNDSKYKR